MAKHFSHDHKLYRFEAQAEEGQQKIICSGCEAKIIGPAYKCRERNCEFYLHKKCFNLPREIEHDSHPGHTLTLYPVPTYPNGFECNACSLVGSAFVYHCPECNYDLHVQCCNMPPNVTTRGHQHSLTLFYSLPEEVRNNHEALRCGVCDGDFPLGFWTYFCEECNYREHLGCEFVGYSQDEKPNENQQAQAQQHHQPNNNNQQAQQQQQRQRQQRGGHDGDDDDDELVVIRRGELNKLHRLLKAKDDVISSYQQTNFMLQNQVNLMMMRNLFRH